MIDLNYRKNLLNELRLVPYIPNQDCTEPTKEMIAKAVTMNENLMAFGYTLAPADILKIAASPSLDCFCAAVEECVGKVDAKPMYPDFPKQVMALDEASFRLHQLIHYLSTYGVESITNQKVLKGWLPDMPETEKVKKDDRLLKAKTIALIDETNADTLYFTPLDMIVSKRERMTIPEKEIVKYAAEKVNPEKLGTLGVPFKQNLMDLFYIVMESLSPADALPVLHNLCQHTGDVLKCMDYCLTRNHYHFRTSQKKLLVKLFESYPEKDFQSNLILSRKKGSRSVLLVQYLDYNEYSRSPIHKEAVRKLRNGELKSWEAQVKYLVSSGNDGALDFIAARPGMLLRMTAWLLRIGYSEKEIEEQLERNASALSTETLITVLTKFSKNSFESQEKDAVIRIFGNLLKMKLQNLETSLKGKKVYVNAPEYDLDHSELRFNDRSEEGGYIRSGLAYKIPEEVKKLRFFVYWNDKDRVDVDLHATGIDRNGNFLHIGWNSDYKNGGVCFSGDITHSDAAEYIDVDLNGDAAEILTSLHLFAGKPSFGEIQTCFTGMMAVNEIGEDVQLYDPANCFFSHELKGKTKWLHYGFINVQDRYLFFDGTRERTDSEPLYLSHPETSTFSVSKYLQMLFELQECEPAANADDADVVLVMGKETKEKEMSLIDNRFFVG